MTRPELSDIALNAMRAFVNEPDMRSPAAQAHMERYKEAMREIFEMDLKRHQGEGA